jgi:hypothetical protein
MVVRCRQQFERRKSMSTIDEVRAAEKRMKNAQDALRKADEQDRELQRRLAAELTSATDEYSKAVRELSSK